MDPPQQSAWVPMPREPPAGDPEAHVFLCPPCAVAVRSAGDAAAARWSWCVSERTARLRCTGCGRPFDGRAAQRFAWAPAVVHRPAITCDFLALRRNAMDAERLRRERLRRKRPEAILRPVAPRPRLADDEPVAVARRGSWRLPLPGN